MVCSGVHRVRVASCGAAILGLLLFAASSLEAGVVIDPFPGFLVTWNGNDGDRFDNVPNNLARASNGATSFSSGDLGPEIGVAFHRAVNINDGLYGNVNSWIGGDAAVPPFFVGVNFGGIRSFRAVAWGRDNGNNVTDSCGGQCPDRALGLYTLQFTQDATVNAASSWTTIATFDYQSKDDDVLGGDFTDYFRHEYVVSTGIGDPVNATGVRLIVPASGLSAGTAVDELEVLSNPLSGPPPPAPTGITVTPAAGFNILWDGNDGDFFDASASAGPPANLALGGIAFSSGDLGPEIAASFHLAANVNDGLYGNINSWIGATAGVAPFHVGVALGGSMPVSRIAWGRDNGNNATDSCGGQCPDRSQGTYTIQFTTDPAPGPGSAWVNVGTVEYSGNTDDGPGGNFTSYFRHEFRITQNNNPIQATGLRLLVPATGLAGGTAIDELEIYGASASDPGDIRPVGVPLNPMALLLLLPLLGIMLLRNRLLGRKGLSSTGA